MFDFGQKPMGSGIASFSNGQGMTAPQAPAPGAPVVPAIAMPGATGNKMSSTGQNTGGFGGNGFLGGIGGIEGLGTIMQGIGSLGQVWASIQAVRMAKDQFNFQKEAYNTNLENQTQTYNTSLEDRIRARSHTEGRGADYVDSYLAEHAL